MADGNYNSGDPRLTPRQTSGYELSATVGIYEYAELPDATAHYSIYLDTFGIRRGQELSGRNVMDNGAGGLLQMLKNMKKPSPVTLVWKPPEGQKLLFTGIRRKKLSLAFSFIRYGGKKQVEVQLLFKLDNVHITQISPEIRFTDNKGTRARYERIDARFSEISLLN